MFTGVEPPPSSRVSNDLVTITEKVHFLMSVVGVKQISSWLTLHARDLSWCLVVVHFCVLRKVGQSGLWICAFCPLQK